MYGWAGDGWGMTGWIAMALLMILFWGGVVAVIVVFLRRPHPNQGTSEMQTTRESAERILDARFARGEIDETEYLARQNTLRRRD